MDVRERARHLLWSGDAGRAWPEYRRLLRQAEEDAAEGRAGLMQEAAEAAWLSGDETEARRLSRSALAAAERDGSPERLAASLDLLCRCAYATGDLDALSALAARAMRLRTSGSAAAAARVHGIVGLVHARRNEHAAAWREHRRAYLAAKRLSPRERHYHLLTLATTAFSAGPAARARRLLELCVKTAAGLDPPAGARTASAKLLLGWLHDRAEREGEAAESLVEAIALADRLSLGSVRVDARARLAMFCAARGLYSAALRLAEAAKRLASEGRREEGMADWRRAWLEANLRLGLSKRVRDDRRDALDRIRRHPEAANAQFAVVLLAEASLEEGDAAEALRLADSGVRRFRALRRDPESPHWLQAALMHCQLLAAEADLEAGRPEACERRRLAAQEMAYAGMPARVARLADFLEVRRLEAAGRAAEAAAAAERTWTRAGRGGGDPAIGLEAGALLVRCLAAAGRAGAARAAAGTTAELLRWIASGLEPAHRRSFLGTRAARAAADALARAEIEDRGESAPASREVGARLAELNVVRAVIDRSGLAARPRRDPAPADAARIEAALHDAAWSVPRTARRLGVARETVWEVEGDTLSRRLAEARGNVRGTARSLGLPQTTLLHKLRIHGLR